VSFFVLLVVQLLLTGAFGQILCLELGHICRWIGSSRRRNRDRNRFRPDFLPPKTPEPEWL